LLNGVKKVIELLIAISLMLFLLHYFIVVVIITIIIIIIFMLVFYTNTKYKYDSYFYCALYSLTDGALLKSANTCFTAVGRLK